MSHTRNWGTTHPATSSPSLGFLLVGNSRRWTSRFRELVYVYLHVETTNTLLLWGFVVQQPMSLAIGRSPTQTLDLGPTLGRAANC